MPDQDYYTILTDTGRGELAAAMADDSPLGIAEAALGDGGGQSYDPTPDQTALVGEWHRRPVNRITVDPANPHWVVVEVVVPMSVGGHYVREVGLVDSDGALIAIAKFPPTYKPTLIAGTGSDLIIRVILEVANADSVELLIDPTVVTASRAYVDQTVGAMAGDLTQAIGTLADDLDDAAWRPVIDAIDKADPSTAGLPTAAAVIAAVNDALAAGLRPRRVTILDNPGDHSYRKPGWLREVWAIGTAAGGGGGGTEAGAGGEAVGSGGGAGGTFLRRRPATALNTTENIRVGWGGPGGYGHDQGGHGGATSFGAHATATGGRGGGGSVNRDSGTGRGSGGLGGSAHGGDLNLGGQAGGSAPVIRGRGVPSGFGGASFWGGGGISRMNSYVVIDGTDGTAPGSGGGGASTNYKNAHGRGGRGAHGLMMLIELEALA
ncbi:phage tail protein [Fodinicurvata sp. EGI_FJ10296]|uniref:phage tail protein n=1 Tax=Fodinicurvata sp. EGI_FJ10296 TaxID=3231908 RepID=UPI0034518864